MANPILQVENLVKRYGDVEAVRGVSFSVEEGEVFGLLGPNGAGKTSTVEVMEGLRVPDGGRISVCGIDPQKNPTELKNEIGATLQSTSLPDKLRVGEALRLFAGFYKRTRNADDLLRRFGRAEAAAGVGDGVGERSAGAFFGRADGGAGPASAAGDLRHHCGIEARKENHLVDHALYRRGGKAVRSRGDCGPWESDRDGDAAGIEGAFGEHDAD